MDGDEVEDVDVDGRTGVGLVALTHTGIDAGELTQAVEDVELELELDTVDDSLEADFNVMGLVLGEKKGDIQDDDDDVHPDQVVDYLATLTALDR